MQGRSRMAASTIAAGLPLVALALAVVSGSAAHAADTPASTPAPAIAPAVGLVQVSLRITGVGPEGCEVEIKPAHAGCEFKPIKKKVGPNGIETLEAFEVRSKSPDRDCSFSITLKEAGKEPLVIKRGLRLETPKADGTLVRQDFLCLLRSPSLAGKDDATRRVK